MSTSIGWDMILLEMPLEGSGKGERGTGAGGFDLL